MYMYKTGCTYTYIHIHIYIHILGSFDSNPGRGNKNRPPTESVLAERPSGTAKNPQGRTISSFVQ